MGEFPFTRLDYLVPLIENSDFQEISRICALNKQVAELCKSTLIQNIIQKRIRAQTVDFLKSINYTANAITLAVSRNLDRNIINSLIRRGFRIEGEHVVSKLILDKGMYSLISRFIDDKKMISDKLIKSLIEKEYYQIIPELLRSNRKIEVDIINELIRKGQYSFAGSLFNSDKFEFEFIYSYANRNFFHLVSNNNLLKETMNMEKFDQIVSECKSRLVLNNLFD